MTIYHVRGATSSEATLLRRVLRTNERLGFAAEISPITGQLQRWQIASSRDEFVVEASSWPLREVTIRSLLEDRTRIKLLHGGQQLARPAAQAGVFLGGVIDSLAVSRLLVVGLDAGELAEQGLSGFELDDLASVLFDDAACSGPSSGAVCKPEQGVHSVVHAARRVRLVRRVGEALVSEVASAGLERAALVESAVALVVGRMEPGGLRVEPRRWRELCGRGHDAAIVAERELCDAFGVTQDGVGRYVGFNASSPKDLAGRLSQLLGVAVGSTNDKALRSISHPVVSALRAYRSGRNLALWAGIPEEGALRPSWSVLGTVTGRVTSHGPNVQGMPHELREAVVAKDGFLFGSFDYGRQELYVLAAVSGDEALAVDLRDGDPYERIARDVGVERSVAKQALLAVSYGSQAAGLREICGITLGTAVALRRSLREAYPKAMAFGSRVRVEPAPDAGEGLLSQVRDVGEVRTRHRRRLVRRGGVNRLSVANTPIQATAADMVKEALVTLERDLREQVSDARIVGTIHDEILVVSPEKSADACRAVVTSAMTRAAERCLHFPSPPVSGGFAKSWAAASH